MKYLFSIVIAILISANLLNAEGRFCSKENGYFVENIGQWAEQVKFRAQAPGMVAWITDTALVFNFFTFDNSKLQNYLQNDSAIKQLPIVNGQAVSMSWQRELSESTLNNHSIRTFERIGEYDSYFNYFYENRSISRAKAYQEIILRNAYDGISIRFYFDGNSLKYDFLLEKGADPRQIALDFSGHESIDVLSDGSLSIGTSIGEVHFEQLAAYEVDDLLGFGGIETKTTSQYNTKYLDYCRFRKTGNATVSFAVPEYSSNRPLVIDPIVWATYLGGTATETGSYFEPVSIVSDSLGYIYVSGTTFSIDFPRTLGAYSIIGDTMVGMYITKINSDGSSIAYSSLVASGAPRPFSITLDNRRFVYTTGFATLGNLPVSSNALQSSVTGVSAEQSAAFLFVLNSYGDNISYSTYLNGSNDDIGYSVNVRNQLIYVGGKTCSSDFITTSGAYQSSKVANDPDGFILGINNTTWSLVFSSFLGGENPDFIYDITTDNEGNVYTCGYSYGSFPITSNAPFQTKSNTDFPSVVVSKLNAHAGCLYSSTYFAPESYCSANSIRIDTSGHVWVCGKADMRNYQPFPTTVNTYNPFFMGNVDCFAARFNSSLTILEYSTLFGGTGFESARRMAIDKQNNVYFVGATQSVDFPTYPINTSSSLPLQNGFVAVCNSDTKLFFFMDCYGGSSYDLISDVSAINENGFFVVGQTYSSDINMKPGALDATLNGLNDAFVVKMCLFPKGDISTNLLSYWNFDSYPFVCQGQIPLSFTPNSTVRQPAGRVSCSIENSGNVITGEGLTNLYSSNGFTWSIWFNSNSVPSQTATGRAQTLISMNDPIAGEEIALGFGFAYGNAPANALSFICDGVGGVSAQTQQAAVWNPEGGVRSNTWYHAVAVANYIEKTIKLFINGKEVSRVHGAFSNIDRQLNAFIGSACEYTNGYATPQSAFFNGRIDQVRFYNRPFNKNDVDSLYKFEANNLFSNVDMNSKKVEFGRLLCEQEKTQTITIFNSGTEPFQLNQVYFRNSKPEFTFNTSGPEIQPNTFGFVNVTIRPRDLTKLNDFLIIDGGQCKPYFEIPVSGYKDSVSILVSKISRDTIDFGLICLGASKDTSFVVKNTSTFAAMLGYSTASPRFLSLSDGTMNTPFAPGESRTVKLRFNANQPGSYSEQSLVSDECGNGKIVYLKGIVNNLDVMLNREVFICQGDSIALPSTVTGGKQPYQYRWSPAISIVNPSSPYAVVFPRKNTTFYLTTTDNNQCSVVDSINVFVIEPYVPVLSGSKNVCSGNTVTYFAESPGGYAVDNRWNVDEKGEIISVTKNSVTVLWKKPGSAHLMLLQTVQGTNCENNKEIEITVSEPPPLNVMGETTVCSGKVYKYYSSNNDISKKAWSVSGGTIVGSVGDTISVQWFENNENSLVLLGNFSEECITSKKINIHLEETPQFELVGILEVETNSDETYSVSDVNYSYDFQVIGGSLVERIDNSTIRVHWDGPGTGKIILHSVSHPNSCESDQEFTIEIKENTKPVISGNDGACSQSSSVYSATSKNGLSYQWRLYKNKGDIVSTTFPNRIQINWNNNGIDTLELIQTVISTGVFEKVIKEININAPATLTVATPDTICRTDEPFDLNYASPQGGKYSGNGVVNGKFQPESADLGENKITYTYKNTYGCVSVAEFSITVIPQSITPSIAIKSGAGFDYLESSAETGNQWYMNGTPIPGAVNKIYAPSASGAYTARTSIGGRCPSEESNSIDFTYSIGPQISSDDKLNFGSLVCETEKLDSVLVYNTGSSELFISECSIYGANRNSFAIIDNPAGSPIPPSEVLAIKIKYIPQSSGPHAAVLEIKSNARNNSVWAINLKGDKQIVDFSIDPTDIEFLRIPEGDISFKRVTITNKGTLPIQWNLPIASQHFVVDQIDPLVTAPGGTSTARVAFAAVRSGDIVFDTLALVDPQCSINRPIRLYATVTDKAAHADLVIGEVRANVGDTIQIPVFYSNTKYMELSKAKSIKTEIKFHKDILFPIDSDGSIFPNNTKIIKRTFDLTQTSNDTIGYLSFVVPLGPDSVTNIEFYGELEIEGEGLVLNPKPGHFYLNNFCREGGFRFFDPNYRRQFNDPTPNPSSGVVTFDMNLIEEGTTKIKILDIKASEIMTAYEYYTKPGTYSITCNLENLPTGVYICLIQTPNYTEMKQLFIVK